MTRETKAYAFTFFSSVFSLYSVGLNNPTP
jgi:hypothetical protein